MARPGDGGTLKAFEDKFPFEEHELKRLQQRKWILHHIGLPQNTVCAEIGVFRGHFSEIICQLLHPRTLYLIDPWTLVGERFGWGKMAYTNDNKLPTAHAKTEALMRCAQYPQTRTVALETWFPKGCEAIADQLDWAYVDADHRYGATLGYLRALDRLVKPDGFIVGDDWHADPQHVHHGVFRAVHALIRESPWHLVAAGPAGQWAIRRYAPVGRVEAVRSRLRGPLLLARSALLRD